MKVEVKDARCVHFTFSNGWTASLNTRWTGSTEVWAWSEDDSENFPEHHLPNQSADQVADFLTEVRSK